MTALQGKYTVKFISHERWMHKCGTGQFVYPKNLFECAEEIKLDIEQKIEEDYSGTFDVIKFLKEMREDE